MSGVADESHSSSAASLEPTHLNEKQSLSSSHHAQPCPLDKGLLLGS